MSNFENEKNSGSSPLNARKIKNTSMHKEIGADFILPDYMGDIKRILKYKAVAVPCNKIISADEFSFLSVLTFRVTYLDSDDMLTEAVFSSDVEFSEKLCANVYDAEPDYRVQNVAIRLGGPRKISAKAYVWCDATFIEDSEICERTEYEGAEMMKKEINVHTAEYLKCSEREYAEEIDRLEELSSDDVEVVKSCAEVFIDEAHKTDDGVNLSGYVDAFCILRADSGIQRLEKRIPVEEHISCALHEDSCFIPTAYVTGVSVNLNNVNSDDECALSVVMAVTVECSAAHHYNAKYSVIKDAFYKGCRNKCSYEKIEFSSMKDFIFEKVPLSAKFERGEEALRDVIERELTVKNLRIDTDGCELTVLCDAELHMIARGNDAESCYSRKEKIEFEKRYHINASKNPKIYFNAIPCDVSISFDTEKIYLDAQILISAVAEEQECEEILSSLKGEEEDKRDERTILVYYPENEDTLWSVSKKYAVPTSEIAALNGINDENFDETKRIIIVK